MNVGVDAFSVGGEGRGMGRFALQLTRGLGDRAILLKPDQAKSPTFPVWEQMFLMRSARRAKADCLLCPYNTAPILSLKVVPTVVVIHDLIYMDGAVCSSVSRAQNIGRLYRRTIVPIAAKRALRIVTVSEYSRRVLCDRLCIDSDRVSVIPNWIDESWFSSPSNDAASRYLLTVSGEAPSKNLPGLLKAFTLFRRAGGDATLKIVGVKSAWHPYFLRQTQEYGITHAVEFLPFLDVESLKTLYRQAAAYVCASFAEGFGIPLLEAMASGVPLASSSATSLGEVAGEAACYFDPRNTEEMSDALKDALSQSSASRARVAKGLEQAWKFRQGAVEPLIEAFWLGVEAAC